MTPYRCPICAYEPWSANVDSATKRGEWLLEHLVHKHPQILRVQNGGTNRLYRCPCGQEGIYNQMAYHLGQIGEQHFAQAVMLRAAGVIP